MRYKGNWKGTAAVLPLLFVALIWAGCGEEALTPNTTTYTADNPPPVLIGTGSAGVMGSAASLSSSTSWYTVAQGGMSSYGGEISGGRYELDFPAGAISSSLSLRYNVKALISIKEYDPDILDIELGPHGIAFSVPVTLEIDYSGTNADPSSPNYDGSVPAFFWFNPATDVWEQMPGENDVSDLEYEVQLTHFSRYAVGGIPGDGTGDW